ncbi:hypothetical protein HK101_001938 [Irineochytrium annulatum]|nr:hypothetical protein HK101_001938 [Irineochytrium annulatum]
MWKELMTPFTDKEPKGMSYRQDSSSTFVTSDYPAERPYNRPPPVQQGQFGNDVSGGMGERTYPATSYSQRQPQNGSYRDPNVLPEHLMKPRGASRVFTQSMMAAPGHDPFQQVQQQYQRPSQPMQRDTWQVPPGSRTQPLEDSQANLMQQAGGAVWSNYGDTDPNGTYVEENPFIADGIPADAVLKKKQPTLKAAPLKSSLKSALKKPAPPQSTSQPVPEPVMPSLPRAQSVTHREIRADVHQMTVTNVAKQFVPLEVSTPAPVESTLSGEGAAPQPTAPEAVDGASVSKVITFDGNESEALDDGSNDNSEVHVEVEIQDYDYFDFDDYIDEGEVKESDPDAPICAFCEEAILDKPVRLLGRLWHLQECRRPIGVDNFAEIEGFLYCEDHYFTHRGEYRTRKSNPKKKRASYIESELQQIQTRSTVRKMRNLFNFQQSVRLNILTIDEEDDKGDGLKRPRRFVTSVMAPKDDGVLSIDPVVAKKLKQLGGSGRSASVVGAGSALKTKSALVLEAEVMPLDRRKTIVGVERKGM